MGYQSRKLPHHIQIETKRPWWYGCFPSAMSHYLSSKSIDISDFTEQELLHHAIEGRITSQHLWSIDRKTAESVINTFNTIMEELGDDRRLSHRPKPPRLAQPPSPAFDLRKFRETVTENPIIDKYAAKENEDEEDEDLSPLCIQGVYDPRTGIEHIDVVFDTDDDDTNDKPEE